MPGSTKPAGSLSGGPSQRDPRFVIVSSAQVAPTAASHMPAAAISHRVVGISGPRLGPTVGGKPSRSYQRLTAAVNDSKLLWDSNGLRGQKPAQLAPRFGRSAPSATDQRQHPSREPIVYGTPSLRATVARLTPGTSSSGRRHVGLLVMPRLGIQIQGEAR